MRYDRQLAVWFQFSPHTKRYFQILLGFISDFKLLILIPSWRDGFQQILREDLKI